MTVLSNQTGYETYNHRDNEEYLKSLLHEASSVVSKLTEMHVNSPVTSPGEHLKGSQMDYDKLSKQIFEQKLDLKHALDKCEVQKQETMAEMHKYKAAQVGLGADYQKHATVTHGRQEKWLVIGIPTVQRSNNEDYLLQTLRAMSEQLPIDTSDILFGKILILVVNVQDNPSAHSRYYEAKKEFHSHQNPRSMYFEFHDSAGPDNNPMPGSNDKGTPNKPGARVRRQTRDIAKVVKLAINKAQYYLFSEDDMVLCPSGLTTMQYMLSKASLYHPDWLAIRASYGMNGIVMRNKDLEEFSNYMIENQKRRPPDHLVVEWYAGETPRSKEYKRNRANIGFRYNIFNHLGIVSTLRASQSPSYLTCYEELVEPTVFAVEAFNLRQCPGDDIWPCQHIEKEKHSHLKLHSLVEKTETAPVPVIPKGKGRKHRQKKKNGRQYRRRV